MIEEGSGQYPYFRAQRHRGVGSERVLGRWEKACGVAKTVSTLSVAPSNESDEVAWLRRESGGKGTSDVGMSNSDEIGREDLGSGRSCDCDPVGKSELGGLFSGRDGRAMPACGPR